MVYGQEWGASEPQACPRTVPTYSWSGSGPGRAPGAASGALGTMPLAVAGEAAVVLVVGSGSAPSTRFMLAGTCLWKAEKRRRKNRHQQGRGPGGGGGGCDPAPGTGYLTADSKECRRQPGQTSAGCVCVCVCVWGGGCAVCTMPPHCQKTLAVAVPHHPPSQGPEPPIPLRQASCRMHPGGLHLHAKTMTTWEMGDGGSKGIGGWARVGVVDRGGRGNVLTRYYTYYAAYTWRFFGVLEFGRECKTQPGAHGSPPACSFQPEPEPDPHCDK
jgi:hypothetical protein